MKVLVVHNRYRSSQPSGENAVVDEEVNLIAGAGHEVRRLELESDEIARWPLRRKAALPFRVVWSVSGYRAVRDAVLAQRPDVTHFHNTFPLLSPAALWAAHRAGTAVVQTLHNFRPFCPASTLLRDGRVCEDCVGRVPWPAVWHACYRNSRPSTLPIAVKDAVHGALRTWNRAVDRFVFPSRFTRAKYVQAGWPVAKLEVKYNTVRDLALTAPRPNSSRRDFVCVSRLVPEKGVDVLLDAWAEAFPAGESRLLVIGSGGQEPSLRARAGGLRGVHFSGQLTNEDTIRHMAAALAVVVPSRWYEVFPRGIVEAYSLGVPVVASEIGSLTELVKADRSGLLFDVGSSRALAAALSRLAGDPALVSRLAAGARSEYERSYTPMKTTETLLRIYRDACAEAAREPASRQ